MGVGEPRAEVGTNDHRRETGSLLLRPGQLPNSIDAAVRRTANPRAGHLAGAEQQIGIDLLERLSGIPIEQRDGCSEEALLVPSRADTAMGAVAQIGEVAQESRRRRRRAVRDHAARVASSQSKIVWCARPRAPAWVCSPAPSL